MSWSCSLIRSYPVARLTHSYDLPEAWRIHHFVSRSRSRRRIHWRSSSSSFSTSRSILNPNSNNRSIHDDGIFSNNLPTSTDLLEVYRGLVARGKIKWDDEQVRCIMKLRHLLTELETYEPPLHLLSRLTPSAPLQAQAQVEAGNKWWTRYTSSSVSRLGMGGKNGGEEERRLVRVLSGEEEIENLTTPKGILLTGPPGKSFLLSLFFSLLPNQKRRAHYHSFTLSLYRSVFQEAERRRLRIPPGTHEANMQAVARRGWRDVFVKGKKEGDDSQTIPFVVARDMILAYHVLYFDELQLVDAASAALIRDVLSWYWRLGGVVISCTNRVPEDLYHHGVQRDRMMGFLDALKSRCEVVPLDGGRDWRQEMQTEADDNDEGSEKRKGKVRWMSLGDEAFEISWEEIPGEIKPQVVNVYGRKIVIPLTKGSNCRFTFEQLCETTLGPADYLSLASTFSTFYIDEIPLLLLKNKNEARRLINLIDALYESRCQLYVRAAAPIVDIFFPDALEAPSSSSSSSSISTSSEQYDPLTAEALSETLAPSPTPNVSPYDVESRSTREAEERREDRAKGFAQLGIFTGEDEMFAYKRAVSRLIQMTTTIGVRKGRVGWADEVWIPLKEEDRAWERSNEFGEENMRFGRAERGPWHKLSEMDSVSKGSGDMMRSQRRAQDDWAEEAGYSRPVHLQVHESQSTVRKPKFEGQNERPKIGEQHAWGIAQWGSKAGRWGKGTEVYREEGGKDGSRRS